MPAPKTINSIAHASDILRCLSEGTDRLVDISDDLRLSKGTIHRLLKALEATGLVVQNNRTRRYYLGSLILKLASNPTIAHQNLVMRALEDMEHLREKSGETIGIHIPIGLKRCVLEELPSLQQLRFVSDKGFTSPLHASAAGKVLLSEFKENELNIFLRSVHLDQVGPNTITDKNRLLAEIKKIRKQGYATSLSEVIKGGAAICVPVRNYVCPVTLGIVGPQERFLPKRMAVLKELKKSAKNISNKLTEIAQI